MLKKFRVWLRGIRWIGKNLYGYELSPEMLCRIEAAAMARKHNEVVSGSFIYYVVDEDTNIRLTEKGIPIIYANPAAADFACVGYDEFISIAAYNRIYGGHGGD